MPALEEGSIQFIFPADWRVLKYDDCAYYRGPIVRTGTDMAAVDFVCAPPGPPTTLLLLEVKDFREHAVENRVRLTSGELATEVVRKVLDTVAALGLGYRANAVDVRPFGAVLEPLAAELGVVLLLEEDAYPASAGGRPTRHKLRLDAQLKRRGDLEQSLLSKLRPLRITSFLFSSATVPASAGWRAVLL